MTGMLDSFLRLFRGEPASRTVWTADLTYWMAGQKARGAWNPAWDTEEGFLSFHRDCGVMPYYEYSRFSVAQPQYDGTVRERYETIGNRTLHHFKTPLGTITEEHVELAESACSGCTKPFVQSERDLDILLYILDHRTLRPANLDGYPARRKVWEAYDGLPALGLPRSPLSSFSYEWAGIANAVYLLADYEDKVRRIFALMEAQEAPVMDAVCRLVPPMIHFPDNLDSENLTGLYDAYLGPTHRRRLDRLHEAGIPCAVHLDGAVRGLLPKLAAAGFDSVEALTPQPAGDMDVADMRALAGNGRVILWGAVPGAMFAPPYQWDDMQRHVERVLTLWKGQRFVLGVADQVPPDGDIGFTQKIREMTDHG
jgi:hypothetical protein